MDKHTYIKGNPLLNRERVKDALIDAILQALKAEGVQSLESARLRLKCSIQQVRYIYKRQQNNVGLQKLMDCCDELNIKITVKALLGESNDH